MTTKLPAMSACFIVTCLDFDPHECTTYFGIAPTNLRVKGEIGPRSKTPIRESTWSLSTKWERYDNTGQPFEILFNVFWPNHKQIRAFLLSRNAETQFLLNITGAGERNFMYEFSRTLVRRINYFRASLALDVY
jgi:hypothetical protein